MVESHHLEAWAIWKDRELLTGSGIGKGKKDCRRVKG